MNSHSTSTQTYRDIVAEYFEPHPFQTGQPHQLSQMLLAPVGSNGLYHKELHPNDDPDSYPNLSQLGVRPITNTHVVGAFFDADLKTDAHEGGISEAELKYLKTQLLALSFQTIIATSKSGNGIHVFVVTNPIPHSGMDDAKRIVREVVAEVFQHLPPKAAKLIDVSSNCLFLWARETTAESFQFVGSNNQPPLEFTPTPAAVKDQDTATNAPDIFERLTTQSQITLSKNQKRLLARIAKHGPVKHAEVVNTFHVSPHTLKLCMEAENLSGDFDTVSDGSSEYTYCHLIPQPDGETFKVVSSRGNPETENWKNEAGKNVTYFPSRETAKTLLDQVDSVVRYIGDDVHIIQSVDVNGRQVERWIKSTKDKAVLRCKAEGVNANEALNIAHKNSWTDSVVPFKSEPFANRRVMNPQAATDFIVEPVAGDFPTWDKMLTHTGSDFDNSVAANPWCKANGITNGRDYLFFWFATAFQVPSARVPGIALYGDVLSGKTKPAEAMEFILAPRLVHNVGKTLRTDFNGSMMRALFLRCEETDLNNSENREYAKDLLTNRSVNLHQKGKPARTSQNISRLWMTTNTMSHIPLGSGDERFVVIECQPLGDSVDRHFDSKLEAEAPHFLHALLSCELPPKHGRLMLPPLMTSLKQQLLDSLVEDQPAIQQLITLLKDVNCRKRNLTGPVTSSDIARLLGVRSSGQITKSLKSEAVQSYLQSCGFKVAVTVTKDGNYRKRLAFEFTLVKEGGAQ